jgi:hypothetical protein
VSIAQFRSPRQANFVTVNVRVRKIPKTWPIILIACLSTVLAWQVWGNREPSWHDRSASYWFEQLYVSTNAVKALGAFHAMGADAVPLLKSRLEEPETPWRSLYAKYWPILPGGIQSKFPAPRPLIEQKIAAAHALAEIGAAGKAAVPALLAILEKPPIDPPAKPRAARIDSCATLRIAPQES